MRSSDVSFLGLRVAAPSLGLRALGPLGFRVSGFGGSGFRVLVGFQGFRALDFRLARFRV